MCERKDLLLGKLHNIDLPDVFPIVHYFCEKKHKTVEDMQFHRHFELGLCLEGQGIFFIGNKMIPFVEGNVSIMPPGTPHFVQSLDEHPSRWLFVAFDVSVPERIPEKITANIVFDRSIEQMLRFVSDELDSKNDGYEKVVADLVEIMLIRASRLPEDASVLFNYGEGLDAVYPAIEYITQHYPEEIEVSTLAGFCDMSVARFRRKFEAVTHMTPLKYILFLRLRIAGVLLRLSERKISDIAFEVGYNTLSSFNRYFKEHYHISPKEYRASFREK
ncbi:MAG: helix-turn-helix transcriptional regulator [Oscillospiraceae bacterium]|nr:helix-turn-helix transcriptional regulator [Oscillospiraceae bacterium]